MSSFRLRTLVYSSIFISSLAGVFILRVKGDERSQESREAAKTALAFFSNRDYGRAVPILERVLAEQPSDPQLLSLLGAAYLYSSSSIDSSANLVHAQPTMERAIEHGGQAIFYVGKTSDKLKGKYVLKVSMGELKIGKDSISFTPARGSADSIGPIPGTEIKACGLNKAYGRDSNTFHIKAAGMELDFRPLHFSKEEANLVCALTTKYFGSKIGN